MFKKLFISINLCLFCFFIIYGQEQKAILGTTAHKAIKQGYVDSPLGQVHYWVAGQGPALLLIHQSSSSGEEYAALVPYLSNKYQLIAFDWIGHGHSDDPLQDPGVEEYTENALMVLNHLGIKKCHVLGHHGGALIAMNIAYKHPDLVNKLILSGTSGLKSKEEAEDFKKSLNLKKTQITDRAGNSISSAWKRYSNYLPEASARELLIPFMNNIMTRIRPVNSHYSVLNWDRRPALNNLEGEVLLLQGAMDAFVEKQETLLDILPNARRVVLENGGAFMFFDKSKELAPIIDDFLEAGNIENEGTLYKRQNILVANLDRSLKIYRDILGFSVFQISKSSKDSYSYPVFKIPKEADLRFATLSSPTQVRTFALTEVKGIDLPKPQIPLMTAAVIKVLDLDKAIQKIQDLGLEITAPKVAQGNDFQFKEQAFTDFDGHLIVLYQIIAE